MVEDKVLAKEVEANVTRPMLKFWPKSQTAM